MKQRIYKLLLIYVVLVAIFALQHPVFIACYHSLFRGVGLGGVCAATWHGLRMDMAMAGYLAIVPGLLAAASVWTAGRAMRYAACIYSAVAAAVVSLSFVVDLCLYGYWGFRLDATPVFYFFTSPADAVASVSGWFVVMGLLAAAAYGAGVYWVLQKILTADVCSAGVRCVGDYDSRPSVCHADTSGSVPAAPLQSRESVVGDGAYCRGLSRRFLRLPVVSRSQFVRSCLIFDTAVCQPQTQSFHFCVGGA